MHVYHIKRKNHIDCQRIPMSYLPLAAEADFLQIYRCQRDNSSSIKRILPKFGIHVYHIRRKNPIDGQKILVSYLPLATETDFFQIYSCESCPCDNSSSSKRILPKYGIHYVYHIKRKNPIDLQKNNLMGYLPLAAETDFCQFYSCPHEN